MTSTTTSWGPTSPPSSPGSSTHLQVWRGRPPRSTGGRGGRRARGLPVERRSPTSKPTLALVACRPLPGSGPWQVPRPPSTPSPSSLLLPPSSLLSSFLPSSLMNLLPSSPVVLLSGTAPGPQHRSRVEWSGLCLLGLLPTALHPLP